MNLWLNEIHTKGFNVNWLMNKVIHTERTEYQELAIVELDEFGKALVLDGNVQITLKDEFIYHEMLAHVPLFSHPHPESVLVIGGGDGGTVREVLKHPSVKQVDLVEIDRRVVEVCQEFFCETAECLKSDRVHIHFKDGIEYVKNIKDYYDVILIDSSDPIGPAIGLFAKTFYENIFTALKKDGLFAAQTESPIFMKEFLHDVFQNINSVFPICHTYLTAVPTYYPGFWTFTIGSKKFHSLQFDESRINGLETEYYTKDIHRAAFALPKFIQKILED